MLLLSVHHGYSHGPKIGEKSSRKLLTGLEVLEDRVQPATVTYQFSGTVTSFTDTSTSRYVPASVQDNVSTYVGTFSFNNSATGQVSSEDAFYRGTALGLTATVTIDNTYTYTLNTPSSNDEIDIIGNSFELFKRGPTVTEGFSPNPPFSHFEFL